MIEPGVRGLRGMLSGPNVRRPSDSVALTIKPSEIRVSSPDNVSVAVG